jgi:hypothetical protein
MITANELIQKYVLKTGKIIPLFLKRGRGDFLKRIPFIVVRYEVT